MDQVEEVKSRVDIVEVISTYLPLRKSGRNFAALCPFHSEKTPSFFVSGERQVFKCFGCGEAGDVFTFLEKMEGWDFKEALEELAKRAGVKLASFVPSDKTREKQKILAINALAAKFYSYLLKTHPAGKRAREYLKGRKIKEFLWEKFNLGYAPGGWENTLAFLQKRGFSLSDIAQTGLIVARERSGRFKTGLSESRQGFYDRFRDRLIFPIKDGKGTILGFSARILREALEKALRETSGQAQEPKYINTPETPVFNKGSLLFGLDVARGAIREKNEVILVEGEFDVLSAYQVGVLNVVASKGTALTDKQVAVLSRLCDNVILCFDKDLAGDAAARRGIELLDLAGLSVKVARLGEYQDPDEFCHANPDGFKDAVRGASNIYDYLIESACLRYDFKSADGKKKIGRDIMPVLTKISDDLVRAHYIGKLAKILDLEVSLVAAAVEKKLVDLYIKEPQGLDSLSQEGKTGGSQVSQEEYFLALLFSQDEIPKELFGQLVPSDFANDKARRLWKWFGDIIKASKSKSLRKILEALPEDLSQFVDNLFLVNISPIFGEKEIWAGELTKIAKRIRQVSLKREIMGISQKLKEAQDRGDNRKIVFLTRRFDGLSALLRKEGA